MSHSSASRNPVSQQDVEVLIGIVATLTGNLLGGDVDPDTSAAFAERFVSAGLLEPAPDGNPLPAGEVGLALEDLVQRLRYAYGDYDEIPEPLPRIVAHVLELPSEEAARMSHDMLPSGQMRDAEFYHDGTNAWQLVAYYPELRPGRDFDQRAAALRQIATRHGGRYSGSQVPMR